MEALLYLVPIALLLGLGGLVAFLWALKSGQFEDLDGAAERILHDEEENEEDSRNDSRHDSDTNSGNNSGLE
ncbi:MAG: cbb3-type cytochrome oxidase assembly protein CcoS [Alphaproteobacteria bacterium]|nr:cbb3-type cytochrome oxidase assembly protein CcoS [Alphaproteobacteria bacterium]